MKKPTEKVVTDALSILYHELRIEMPIDSDTIIYGTSSLLNSLSLVRLIVEIEDAIFLSTGQQILIANDRALSLKHSPFYSVATLSAYINTLLNDTNS